MELYSFQREVVLDVLSLIGEVSFPAIYEQAVQQRLLTRKTKAIVSSHPSHEEMYTFWDLVQHKTDFFVKFLDILNKAGEGRLRNQILDNYYTRIALVLHTHGDYKTESLD